jgi:hypothetical protein
MNASTTARQRLLQYFDQCDRERPGDFTVAGAAIEALEGLDVHTALQELRRLGRNGQLELVGAPIGVVHGLTYVRITNKGRKAGESATDRDARTSVLHYIAMLLVRYRRRAIRAPICTCSPISPTRSRSCISSKPAPFKPSV